MVIIKHHPSQQAGRFTKKHKMGLPSEVIRHPAMQECTQSLEVQVRILGHVLCVCVDKKKLKPKKGDWILVGRDDGLGCRVLSSSSKTMMLT